jgi:hypothetical protein
VQWRCYGNFTNYLGIGIIVQTEVRDPQGTLLFSNESSIPTGTTNVYLGYYASDSAIDFRATFSNYTINNNDF